MATYVLMGICVALGIGALLSGGQATGVSDSLGDRFGVNAPDVAGGEVYRLLSAGFLHAGLPHLLVNMYSLYILGSLLEPALGRVRFLIIYFVALLSGSFGALISDPNINTVGASTAIFGLMGAAVVVMRNRGIDPMASGLPLWIGINLVLTFTIPHLSKGGHVGGLIGGVLAAALLFELPDRVRRLPQVAAMVLAGAVGVAAVAGSLAIV